jgi:hypothetical protein
MDDSSSGSVSYDDILKAMLNVTHDKLPCDSELSSVRSDGSYWEQVVKTIHPHLKWSKKIKQLALKYYKIYKGNPNNKHDLKDIISSRRENGKQHSDEASSVPPKNLQKYVYRGNFHQGTELPGRNLEIMGKQCTAICAVAIAMAKILPPDAWTSEVMDKIMNIGDELYVRSCLSKGSFNMLNATELEKKIVILGSPVKFIVDNEIGGTQFGFLHPDPNLYGELQGLNKGLSLFFDTNESGIITIGGEGYSLAIWKYCGLYWLFDSHSRDESGKLVPEGTSFCSSFMFVASLAKCILQNFPKCDSTAFTITYVIVVMDETQTDGDFKSHMQVNRKTASPDSSNIFPIDIPMVNDNLIVEDIVDHNSIPRASFVSPALKSRGNLITSTPVANLERSLNLPVNESHNLILNSIELSSVSKVDLQPMECRDSETEGNGPETAQVPDVANAACDSVLHNEADIGVFKTPNKVSIIQKDVAGKRCISKLKPAKNTEETNNLGIQLNFQFTLPLQFWEDFYVQGKFQLSNEDGERWTNIMAESFKKGNSFCVLKINNKVVRTPSKARTAALLTVTAQCQMEHCFMFKFYVKKDNNALTVDVKTYGTFTHYGDKHRRFITGKERKQMVEETDKELPNELKIKKIYDKKQKDQHALDRGNFDHAPSQKCMQKISSEGNLAKYLHKDIWTDLEMTADELEKRFKTKIFSMKCKYPFMVIWQSDNQIKFYLRLPRPIIIHIDATGSEICQLIWALSDVHRYAMVTPGSKKGKPPLCIGELLTEVKNTTKVTHWLQTWQDEVNRVNDSNGCPHPDIVVIDYSWVLIHSVLRSFCDMNLTQYLESLIKAKDVGKVTHTVLHLCIAHVTKAVAIHLSKSINTECLMGRQVRRLALHLMAALQRTDDLLKAKWLFGHFSAIFDSEQESTVVAQSLKEVSDTLSADKENEFIDDILKEVDAAETAEERAALEAIVIKDEKTLWLQSPFTKEFMSVVVKKSENVTCTSNPDNVYYIPGFTEYILKTYMAYYPLWSCYALRMVGHTDENPKSNWASETHFNTSKNHMLQKKLRQRPGSFLMTTVPKVQQRLADAEYDVDFKKNKPRAKRPLSPSSEIHDQRQAIDKWKKGRKSRGKPKGQGAYSTLVARKKYKPGSQDRLLIDKIKSKYLKSPFAKKSQSAHLSPVHEEQDEWLVDNPPECGAITPCHALASPNVSLPPVETEVEANVPPCPA